MILVPLPGIGTLALSEDAYRVALAAGADLAGAAPSAGQPAPEPLVDAAEAAAALKVSERWLADEVRAGICPHVRLGKFVRFRVGEVASHYEKRGAPVPAGRV